LLQVVEPSRSRGVVPGAARDDPASLRRPVDSHGPGRVATRARDEHRAQVAGESLLRDLLSGWATAVHGRQDGARDESHRADPAGLDPALADHDAPVILVEDVTEPGRLTARQRCLDGV